MALITVPGTNARAPLQVFYQAKVAYTELGELTLNSRVDGQDVDDPSGSAHLST